MSTVPPIHIASAASLRSQPCLVHCKTCMAMANCSMCTDLPPGRGSFASLAASPCALQDWHGYGQLQHVHWQAKAANTDLRCFLFSLFQNTFWYLIATTVAEDFAARTKFFLTWGDCSANGQIFSSSSYRHLNRCCDQQCRLVIDSQNIMQF